MPLPFTSAGRPDKPVFLSSTETSSIVVEKKDEITASLCVSSSSRMVDGGSRSMHETGDTGAVQATDAVTGGGNLGSEAVLPALTDAARTATVASAAQVVYVYIYTVHTPCFIKKQSISCP